MPEDGLAQHAGLEVDNGVIVNTGCQSSDPHIYAVGDDRVLLLTTDRISAFDVVMAETIPMKGAVLTQISAWWFRQLESTVPHHMISADADDIIRAVPELKNHRDDILGRAMLGVPGPSPLG